MEFSFTTVLGKILGESGFAGLFGNGLDGWKSLAMILIAFVLLYMGIAKKFEPLLLVPIAFGMLLANLPNANIMQDGGLLNYFYYGVKFDIYPPLIFMGVGAMTDFGPLIARPSSLLLGAAAQFGIFSAFLGALLIFHFPVNVAASIGIIGGADGPTAIMVTSQLAPEYLSAIAIAAYSYMALIPMIQPPIMKAFTRKEDRKIKMTQLREVSKAEKIIFPIAVATIVILLLPDTAPLIGMLMLGNLFRECGVCDRLSDTVQNALMNSITILLGTSVGATAAASTFLTWQTIFIIVLGLVAFLLSTFGGVIFGDIMCWVTKGKINPLIGSAGVSAVPMAARVAQIEGQKENPSNFLLMHAMGPNVAGVIGSAAAAGFFLKLVPMLLG
ncbi:MAG: sodium ion-translocating decarboxylase subunit beta [Butyricicoccus sp.]|nr:sodium ion-translocating decarboxylase subunit beta [Butyricicoccus sp.]MDY4087178.1 sodium ion-translocating decarboxylase subunit beta [Butyricicoccus intestinisimiae]